MGHNLKYYDYPENVDRAKVEQKLNDYAAHEDWQEGCSGLSNPIRWLNDGPLDDYDAALAFIERHDRHDYDQLAVRYKVRKRQHDTSKPSKKLMEKREREKAYEESLKNLLAAASVKNRQSEYIGCPECGSKLKREKLNGERCPLCGTDLRSPTMQGRIQNAQKKLAALRKDIAAQVDKENRCKAKPEDVEIRWLVKIEYHT